MDRAEAEQLSRSPAVLADVAKYGTRFCDVDASIRLHSTLGIEEPWNTWEWPRRIAALRSAGDGVQGKLL